MAAILRVASEDRQRSSRAIPAVQKIESLPSNACGHSFQRKVRIAYAADQTFRQREVWPQARSSTKVAIARAASAAIGNQSNFELGADGSGNDTETPTVPPAIRKKFAKKLARCVSKILFFFS